MNPTDFHFWLKILTTIFCGGVIGLERQLRGKPAGIRTSILICMGTCTYVSIGADIIGTVDPTRVLAQVVTGVGFIGAGVIMSKPGQESVVVGVTSAAIIWMLAAVGATIGLGRLDTAISLTLVAVGVLLGVELLESSFLKLRRGVHAKYRQVDDDSQENRKGPLSS
ncbi:MAG: MgtC/SapB family protein [Desulfobulbus sp.]|jgi:putative Mg2+ transporter-C (MgtC) family protein|nr:MAG: MgtC/SapB family protein [Desulfobulbus sp.]